MFRRFIAVRAFVALTIPVFALFTSAAGAIAAHEAQGTKASVIRMLDARVNAKDAWQRSVDARPQAATSAAAARSQSVSTTTALATLLRDRPGLEVQMSSLTGGPRSASTTIGALTAAAPGKSSMAIASDYLSSAAGVAMGFSADDVAGEAGIETDRGRARGITLEQVRRADRVRREAGGLDAEILGEREGDDIVDVGKLEHTAHASFGPGAATPG